MSIKKPNKLALVWLVLGLLIGVGLTLLGQKFFVKSDIQKAKDQIISQYTANSFDISPKQCSNLSKDSAVPKNTILSVDDIKAKLKVNKFVNRAILVGCGESEELLVKKPNGTWVQTQVNLSYGTRVNPTWQKACLIQDITTADTVVRPENSSIDMDNLKECQTLSKVYDLQIDPNPANPDNPVKLTPL